MLAKLERKKEALIFNGSQGAKYIVVQDLPALEQVIGAAATQRAIAIDLCLRSDASGLAGLAISWGLENSYYLLINHDTNEKQLITCIDETNKLLQELLASVEPIKILWDGRPLIRILNKTKYRILDQHHDAQILTKIIDENEERNIDEVTESVLGTAWGEYWQAFKYWRANSGGRRSGGLFAAGFRIAGPALAERALQCFMLWKRGMVAINGDQKQQRLYSQELALSEALFDIENYGMYVDKTDLIGIQKELDSSINKTEEVIFKLVGKKIDTHHSEEVKSALASSGILVSDTDGLSLAAVSDRSEIAKAIINHRALRAAKNGYVDVLLRSIDSFGFVNTTIRQDLATGRMASSSPNLMGIPEKVRSVFRVPPSVDRRNGEEYADHIFLFADYDQIELRLLAHHSKDPWLIACFPKTGKSTDLHEVTGALIANVAISEFMHWPTSNAFKYKHFRDIGKAINYSIIYGAEPEGVQKRLAATGKKLTIAECIKYRHSFMERFKVAGEFLKQKALEAESAAFIENTFGRKRHLTNESYLPRKIRQHINFIFQSDAADIFKNSIIRINKLLKSNRSKTKIANVIHDEIVFYWNKKDGSDLIYDIKKAMENYEEFTVPLEVKFSIGKEHWGKKEKLELVNE